LQKNSKIIICDEATSSLDALIKKEIIELLLDLKREFELSMIFISHNLKLIHKICDEVVFLKNGKLVEKGNTTDVFKSPKSNYTKNLIKLNFKPIVKKSKNEPSNINLLKIEKLNLEINNLKILSEINFNLKRNEILGIIGESGSGKTSIARCILNIYRNYTGNIYFNKNNIKNFNRTDLSKKIQVIFQDPYASLDPSVKVINQIIEVLKFHKIAANNDLKETATSILESVNLNSKLHNKLPSELSGGERQRVVIARAISISPKVLICDECVSALDKNVQKLILELLLKIKEKMSLSLIFISHDISLIQSIADRIVVLKNGVILDYRETEKVINNPKKYTKQLISASF
jgi:ABC-type glutathione transport system ATPase component